MKEILIGLTMLGLFAFAFFIADRIGKFLEAVAAQNAEDAEEPPQDAGDAQENRYQS